MPASSPVARPARRNWLALARLAGAAVLLGAFAMPSARTQEADSSAGAARYAADPRFRAEAAAARAPGESAETATAHWAEANRIAGGGCLECLERLSTLHFRAGQFEAAAEAAAQFAALTPKATDKAYAELLRGSALLRLHDDRPSLLELDSADQTFKAALEHDPSLHTALFLDGRVLAALHRDTEARAVFRRYLEAAPADDRYRARAGQYLANLPLARATMAPPFRATALDGQTLTLDSLRGRVVLLDFWATWCVPCRQVLPQLQRLAADLRDQPFSLISISWDESDDAWRQYIAENTMTWPQVLDKDHKLSALYGVDALPHYFTIDRDGALQSEVVGAGEQDLEARIKALVQQTKHSAVAAPVP